MLRLIMRGSSSKLNTLTRMVWVLLVALAFLLALALLPPSKVHASTVIETDLRTLSKEAQVIFAGTVRSKYSEWTPNKKTIVTRVLFENIESTKGIDGRRTVELTMNGGTVGRYMMGVDGNPEFGMGERYVLLCTTSDLGSPRNSYLPIIGLYLGYFRVTDNAIYDHADRPIVSVEDGHLVVVDRDTESIHSSPSTPIDIDYVPSRAEIARRDSTLDRARARAGMGAAKTAPSLQPRPSVPEGTSTRSKDWKEGSQRVAMPVGQPVKVLRSNQDPGVRISESQFLQELHRLGR
jgi:hypothetical protein